MGEIVENLEEQLEPPEAEQALTELQTTVSGHPDLRRVMDKEALDLKAWLEAWEQERPGRSWKVHCGLVPAVNGSREEAEPIISWVRPEVKATFEQPH